MKRSIGLLVFLSIAMLLIACGSNDEGNENQTGTTATGQEDVDADANEKDVDTEKSETEEGGDMDSEDSDEKNAEEEDDENEKPKSNQDKESPIPAVIPSDFPFPETMWNVHVSKEDDGDGWVNYVIGFSHKEDPDDVYNEMKTFLENEGCVIEEIGGRAICDEYDGDSIYEFATVSIGDKVSTVTFDVEE